MTAHIIPFPHARGSAASRGASAKGAPKSVLMHGDDATSHICPWCSAPYSRKRHAVFGCGPAIIGDGSDSMSRKRPKPITKICATCGSLAVTHCALVNWDADSQQWEIACALENADCDSCGGCRVEDRPAGFDPFSEAFDIDRIEIRWDGVGYIITHYRPGERHGAGVQIADVMVYEHGEDAADALALKTAADFAAKLPGPVSTISTIEPVGCYR